MRVRACVCVRNHTGKWRLRLYAVAPSSDEEPCKEWFTARIGLMIESKLNESRHAGVEWKARDISVIMTSYHKDSSAFFKKTKPTT